MIKKHVQIFSKFDIYDKKWYNINHVIKFRGDIILKKRIMISLLFGLIICCTAVYSFGTTGIVNTDTLRLRKSNSKESSILTLLSIDEKVEILTRTEDGWYKVKYTDYQGKNYEGYVSEDYITVKDDSTIQKEPSEEIETSEEENNANTEVTNPQEEVGTEEKVEESTTKIIKKGKKVYTIPLINSNTIKILEKDVNVEVLTELNGWSYVSTDEFEGWVRTSDLTATDAQKKVGYISGTSVNFREQPDTSGEVIKKLSRNKKVVILEETNGWTKIEVDGKQGYVNAQYVSDKKVETTARSSSRRTTNKTTTTQQTNTSKTETTENKQVSNASISEIVAYAKKYLGYKYVYGGATPAGFDCSGFTQYVYKHFGYSLSRTSRSQAGDGAAVSKSNLQQGDIICFSGSSGSKKITHVGMYIGGGKFIHAANSRKGVIISDVDGDGFYYVCARRIVK